MMSSPATKPRLRPGPKPKPAAARRHLVSLKLPWPDVFLLRDLAAARGESQADVVIGALRKLRRSKV